MALFSYIPSEPNMGPGTLRAQKPQRRSSSMVAAPVGRVCLVEGTAWTKARSWEGPKLRNYKKISLAKAG